ALARTLQDMSSEFRASQSGYLRRLKSREDRSASSGLSTAAAAAAAASSSGGGSGGLSGADDDGLSEFIDRGFALQLVEDNTALVQQREQEINSVLRSIQTQAASLVSTVEGAKGFEELGEIFTDVARLVVDQGEVIDRIDYNLDQVETRVHEGLQQLKKAEKYQKKNRKMLIILILAALVVFFTILLVFTKFKRMCLKQVLTFEGQDLVEDALWSLRPGWLVKFKSGHSWQTGVYIGIGLLSISENGESFVTPRQEECDTGNTSPLHHLVCHLPRCSSSREGVLAIKDFRELAENSESIKVFECNCDEAKRKSIIRACLTRLGESWQRDESLDNNSASHYLRSFTSARISPKSKWSGAAVQFERLNDSLQGLDSFFNELLNSSTRSEENAAIAAPESDTRTTRRNPPSLDCYPVTSPQGFCAVININNYDDNTNLGRRSGSEQDVARIREVFGKLNFVIEVKEDLTSHEIDRFLTNLAHDERLEQHGCFRALLDGARLRSEKSSGLRGKPKIIVIQACRGTRLQFGQRGPLRDSSSDNGEFGCYSPRGKDFLVCFASGGDTPAFRDANTGSDYVQALCREVEAHYQSEHIVDIVTRVNNAVWRAPVQQGELQLYTAPEFTSSLTKKHFANFEKMCLKEKHEFKDDKKIERALELLKPGWAVAFDRGVYFHFCIYLGTGLVSESTSGLKFISVPEDSSPVRHFICQLTKRRESGTSGRGDIWIDDFRAAARDSNIIVYECDCPASRRAEVVEKCLNCQGETQYSLQDNNCEHFVRQMLESKPRCLQKLQLGKLFKDRSLPTSTSASSLSSRDQYGLAKKVFVFLLRDENDEAVKSSVRLRHPQQLFKFVYAKLHPEKDGRFRFVEFLDKSSDEGGQASATVERVPAEIQLERLAIEPRLRSYTATSSPQGFCLVINIRDYEHQTGLKCRPESEADVNRVKSVFDQLDFTVRIAENLKTHQIYKMLHDYASDEALFGHGCFVCFLMAHGTANSILGSDGEELELRSITQTFSSSVCPGLRGKPKLFFLQTSQKEELKVLRHASSDSTLEMELRDLAARGTDFIVCRSTSSLSSSSCPSFVQTLCSEIESQHKEANILKIVTSVNNQLIKNSARQSVEDEADPTSQGGPGRHDPGLGRQLQPDRLVPLRHLPRPRLAQETLDEPIPLVCHFSGDASSEPMASVRLDDLREVVQNSTVRVYKCSCEPAKRMRVVRESLARVGEEGYNLVTNNCEHFVRDIINNRKFSYQSFWTFAAPLVQLPRLLIGAPIGGSIASSASLSACVASSLTKFASLGLINPDMDLLEISLSGSSGLSASVDVNPCCTKVYTGPNQSIEQELYHCLTCGITGSRVVCRACVFMCHTDCDTRCFNDGPGFCDCQHQMCLVSSEAAPFDEPTESAEVCCK
uniref:t-SNARE coiled-coil homology domain-containing protein n=1 Tax=Macrostomum lignano TaxID=282301 RepID=A0A1I8IWA4_9PLAT